MHHRIRASCKVWRLTVLVDPGLWLPTLVWGALFFWSYRTEPRRFRHAFFFFFLFASALAAASAQLNQWWISPLIALVLMRSPFTTIVFLFINEVTLVRREGFSLSHALPLLCACTIIPWFVTLPAALLAGLPAVVIGLVVALTVCGA